VPPAKEARHFAEHRVCFEGVDQGQLPIRKDELWEGHKVLSQVLAQRCERPRVLLLLLGIEEDGGDRKRLFEWLDSAYIKEWHAEAVGLVGGIEHIDVGGRLEEGKGALGGDKKALDSAMTIAEVTVKILLWSIELLKRGTD